MHTVPPVHPIPIFGDISKRIVVSNMLYIPPHCCHWGTVPTGRVDDELTAVDVLLVVVTGRDVVVMVELEVLVLEVVTGTEEEVHVAAAAPGLKYLGLVSMKISPALGASEVMNRRP